MMPRFVKEVRFSYEPGKVRASGEQLPPRLAMFIDGEPFPYYIAEQPRIDVDPTTGIHTVHVGILADDVVVIDATGAAMTRGWPS